MPQFVKSACWAVTRFCDPYANLSYSQDGEDMIVDRLFTGKSDGFYVDVGAHHPVRFSNTCIFHRRGWRGINIDADSTLMAAFERARPADINLAFGVAEHDDELQLSIFDDPALNTLNSEVARQLEADTSYRVVERRQISVRPLRALLEEHLPGGCEIDLLNVDAEGLDLSVLKSNDWQRFRPQCTLVEAGHAPLDQIRNDPVFQFMVEQGYSLYAKTVRTLIFTNSEIASA